MPDYQYLMNMANCIFTLNRDVAEFSLNLKKSWFLIRNRVLIAISTLKIKNTQLSDCRIVGLSETIE